jgi:polyvinyl alcohol dehydrogenase (cytochrome)
MRARLLALLILSGLPAVANAQSTTEFPKLFELRCARCHENPTADTPAPNRQALMQMTAKRVYTALTTGSMAQNAQGLTKEQIFTLVQGLTGRPVGDVDISAAAMSNACGAGAPLGNPLAGREWNGWSPEADGSRFQSAQAAGLKPEQLSQLKLKWAFGFPGGVSAWGPVTIAGGWLFVGNDNGAVYALDPRSGCVHWSFEAKTGVRSAVSVGPAKGVPGARFLAYFGDIWANVYAVNAETGKQVWMTQVDDYKQRRILASVVLDPTHGRLYVPVTSLEGMAAPSLSYECCKFRGSVVALDVATGKQIWKRYALPEQPQPIRVTTTGTQLYGPAGGAVWNTPSIDLSRNTAYFGTGNDYIYPATEYTDAVVAADLTNGQVRWRYQLLAGDANDGGCGMTEQEQRLNCPNWRPLPTGTEDVATSPILRTLKDGRRVVIGMTQSTLMVALDERTGTPIWPQRHASPLGPLPDGGVYGAVADADKLYVPLYYRDRTGGMVAIDIATGRQVWYTPIPKPQCDQPDARWCSSGNYAAAAVIPGAVFAGAIDGTIRAFSTSDGRVLWEYQTRRDFTTVNGVAGKGGSIHFQPPTIVNGMVYICSGWAGEATGNVLLAFGTDAATRISER